MKPITPPNAAQAVIPGNIPQQQGVTIVPLEEHDGLLEQWELEMRFGEPVIANGTNYSELSNRYLQALGRNPIDEAYTNWISRSLSDFAQESESAEIKYAHRVLVEYDKLRKEGLRGKGVHEILVEK